MTALVGCPASSAQARSFLGVRLCHLGYSEDGCHGHSRPFTMGFVLSVLYFVTYYLTPTTMFGPLAPFRIELILAVLVFLVSLPALMKSFILKTPQSLALIGLALGFSCRCSSGTHWAGGGVQAILVIRPECFRVLSCLPALQVEEAIANPCPDDAVCLPVCHCARVFRSASRVSASAPPMPGTTGAIV